MYIPKQNFSSFKTQMRLFSKDCAISKSIEPRAILKMQSSVYWTIWTATTVSSLTVDPQVFICAMNQCNELQATF